MPRRAFVPDSLGRLEDRVVLSGGPVVVSNHTYNFTLSMVWNNFEQYATDGKFQLLRANLAMGAARIPFHRPTAWGRAPTPSSTRCAPTRPPACPGPWRTPTRAS